MNGYQGNVWAGMESVDATGMRLPRVADGMHVLRVNRCLVPRTPGQLAYIVEFEVVQSSNPSHVPGSQCSVYMSSKFHESLLKQVKAFVAAASGYDLTDPAQDQIFSPHSGAITDASISQHNTLEGRTVTCEASFSGRADKRGQPYFNYVWGPNDAAIPLGAAPPPPGYGARPAPAPAPAYPPQGYAPQGAPPAGYGRPAPAPAPAYPPQGAPPGYAAPPAAPPGYAPPAYGAPRPAAPPQAPAAPPGAPPQPFLNPATNKWEFR